MKRIVPLLAFVVAWAGLPDPARPAPAAARPNFVVILADDLGFADVGFNGGREIRTPHLDRLASSGVRLARHYVHPLCSPTRAALLTGRYPMRYGLQVGVIRPYEARGLPLEERTLASALRAAGYQTALVGKWHLGMHTADYLPTRRGFDRQYGHYCGAIDYFTHERDGGFDWHRDDRVCRDEGYSTQLIAREAVRIVRTRDRTRPFFLYVAFNAVHGPHQVPARYAEPYAPLREPRRTYAGMVAAMDEAVGQIVDALDSEAIRQHTLILFSSDNGGPAPGRVTDNGPLRGAKGTLYEGGVRVCALANWPGRLPAGCVVNAPVHAVDWMPTLLGLADAQLEPGPPLDGRDVWANIVGASGGDCEREILLNASPDSGALIVGDWKLVLGQRAWDGVLPGEPGKRAGKRRMGKGAAGAVPVQLFNLADDTGESRNLAETCPDRVTAMRARYDAFAAAALPPANREAPPGFKPPAVWGPDLGR